MDESGTYRDHFYDRYYTIQEGRRETEMQGEWVNNFRTLEQQIIPHLPQDREVKMLDAGCGQGRLLRLLEDHGYKNIYGIDTSQEQIKKAREADLTCVEQADIFDFLKRSGSWEVITAIDLIEHFSKAELVQLLELMNESLASGGKIVVRTPNIDAPFGSVYAYGDFTHGNVLNRSSASQLFHALGYSNVRVLPAHPVYEKGIRGWAQRFGRRIIEWGAKCIFFATGRSMENIVLTSNMIVTAESE